MTVSEAQFEVEVTLEDCQKFADLSGDWNPLHTDPTHAGASVYRRQVLHGAFSAGLISRLAGMYLPGKDCLLYAMKLRFVTPVLPPAKLVVSGKVVTSSNEISQVKASISDAVNGSVYVEAFYEFGSHRMSIPTAALASEKKSTVSDMPLVLVTGGSGGLGNALLQRLGERGQSVTRNKVTGRLDIDNLPGILNEHPIEAIVHCGWPTPDNRRFIDQENPVRSIEQNVSGPLQDIQFLASLIARKGCENAPLILIGSTYAKPGRHYFRMPLYSIAKSTIPTVVGVLALELASENRRCLGIVFDMLDGGMNKGISESVRLANADRSPWGDLGTPDEAAEQITWLLENQSKLISGATLTLSAGAIP